MGKHDRRLAALERAQRQYSTVIRVIDARGKTPAQVEAERARIIAESGDDTTLILLLDR